MGPWGGVEVKEENPLDQAVSDVIEDGLGRQLNPGPYTVSGSWGGWRGVGRGLS